MNLFFEIAQHVMGVSRPVTLTNVPIRSPPSSFFRFESPPSKQQDNLSNFWTAIFATAEPRFCDDVCFQFYMYMSGIYMVKQQRTGGGGVKFQHFFKMLENIFFRDEFREKLLSVFCKSQQTYYGFSRLAQRWKMKHARCTVDYDLALTPIDRTKPRQYMTLYQNGATYLFRLGELTQMVETALCHCCSDFFVDSYVPRNPYTNEPFSAAMLLAMYLAIRESAYRMPILFELFFREFFSTTTFIYKYEGIIRERFIERLVQYGDVDILSQHIRKMLRYVHVFPHMDPKFPKTQLVNIFRPYLPYYFCHLFSTIHGEKKENAYNVLFHQLHRLMNYNPRLGRRVIIKRKSLFSAEESEKLRLKYMAVPSAAHNDADVGFVEVFSIDHLPFSVLEEGEQSVIFFQITPSDEENGQEENDDDDDEEDDF
jgi:hypothetical protein